MSLDRRNIEDSSKETMERNILELGFKVAEKL